ncbi:MAG: DUF6273 domain-containing protein [Acutalibacteraceae bacterium]|nr:DUF6273 domain-containing protein [Acutalibacteraceae bacterium]
MKTAMKKALSALLAVVIIATTIPFTAFAEDADEVTAETKTEFSTQSGLNQIVQNLSEAEDSQDYSITNLEMNGKKGIAVINNAQACKLVAAIYEEGSSKMLTSAVVDVEASAGEVEFEFDILSMPETYTVKVFLLDENNAALCDEYVYLEKTEAFKEFLAKEPEDFNGEDVIIFDDEKAQTDFAVLDDDVKTSSSKSITYSYNESTGKHTFRNADNTLKNLSAGDIYSYKYGDAAHEVVVIKVKEITVSGSTVTIIEDTEIGLGEAFSFVRIDAVGDCSSVDSGEAEYGSVLTPVSGKKRDIVVEENEKDEWKTSAELSYKKGVASVTGTVGCTFTSHVKLFYNPEIFGPDYYEFYTELVTKISIAGLEVKGEISLPKDECRIESPEIPVGPFMLRIYVAPIVELSATFSCSVSYTAKTVVTADNVNGVSRTTTGSSGFEPKFDDKIEFRVGLELGVDLGWGDIVKLNGNCSLAVVWVAEVDTVGVILDKHHDCYTCVKGDNFIEVGIEFGLIVKIIPDVMDFEWPAVEITRSWSLGEFYCSLSKNGFESGKGTCPNISYETKIKVYDKDAKNIEGATVFCATGYCDSNGDGKFEENTTVTDAEGEAIFYLNSDTHFIKVTKPQYKEAVQKVVIVASGKKVPIKLEVNGPYDVTVTVKDANGNALQDVTVTAKGDEDNDEETDIYTTNTDSSGVATLSLYSADWEISVAKKSYSTQSFTIYSLNENKESTVTLKKVAFEVGDIIEFGSYPQTEVTDSVLISELDKISKNWTSYEYYSGTGSPDGKMKPGDWMKFADIDYGGERYRAVTFSQYRPNYVYSVNREDFSAQSKNGYYIDNTYYFLYEPVKWRVLDPENGYIMCEDIIDAQPFNNTIYRGPYNSGSYKTIYFTDSTYRAHVNDYSQCSLRDWLNDDFYNTAFSSVEKKEIQINECVNKVYDEYSLKTTTTYDNVFLLTYWDARNEEYGFENSTSDDITRLAICTDYAKSQGAFTFDSNGSDEIYGEWILRTPYSDEREVCYVFIGTLWIGLGDADQIHGVRPAMIVDLQSFNDQLIESQSVSEDGVTFLSESVDNDAPLNIGKFGCIAGNRYVLLNVSNYSEDFELNSADLLYIDMLRADVNGIVSATFTPKSYDENSTLLLIGDFGSGTEAKVITEGEPEPEIKGKVHSVSIDDISMLYKDSATVTPSINVDSSVNYTVTYSSSNTDVVSVDSNGNITTNDKGSATITVTVTDEYGNTVSDTCEVNVKYKWWQWIIVIVLFGWIWY